MNWRPSCVSTSPRFLRSLEGKGPFPFPDFVIPTKKNGWETLEREVGDKDSVVMLRVTSRE
jgi:hypothetical protein